MCTNRIDILDPALLRPGRIDRKIEFPNPNENARLEILKIHSRKMNLTRGINLRKIADTMPGASGAEIKVHSLPPAITTAHTHAHAHVIARTHHRTRGTNTNQPTFNWF
jgi:ATP-dependent 26S proteasome regulatory subunit